MITINQSDRDVIQQLIQHGNSRRHDCINPASVNAHKAWRSAKPEQHAKWWDNYFIHIDGHLVSYQMENHPMVICKHMAVALEHSDNVLPEMTDIAKICEAFTINSYDKILWQLQNPNNSPNILDYSVNDVITSKMGHWETEPQKLAYHVYILEGLRSISKIAAVNIGPDILVDSTMAIRSDKFMKESDKQRPAANLKG